jgi:hypothetical protein
MKFELQPDDLRPLVQMVVTEVIERFEADRTALDGRLAYTEPEAAALIGVQPHVLGDARRRGEIVGARVGKRILYERDQLITFLRRNRAT